MALLTVEQRKQYLKDLGYGEYNSKSVLAFQKDAFPSNEDEQDGICGIKTDTALTHFHNVWKCTKNFKPQEFRCECGGKYCTGYPSYMKQAELKNLQSIRDHWNRPMKVRSGLRCTTQNRIDGGVPDSGHLSGRATDFYMKGVTDSVPNRNKALKWIKKLPNHKFTYGAYMVDSDGAYRTARGMGDSMHTETR